MFTIIDAIDHPPSSYTSSRGSDFNRQYSYDQDLDICFKKPHPMSSTTNTSSSVDVDEEDVSIQWVYWESRVGSVIQATGTVELENGLWIGNHLKARNGLQRVCTIPGVRPGAVRTPGFLQGQTEFKFAWVCVAWFNSR